MSLVRFKPFVFALGVAGGTAAATAALSADTATATMAVSATVANNCTITTNPIAFGGYDPIVSHATSPLDAAGAVTLTCTKGAVTTVGLDTGANADAGTRRLAAGSSFLTYELYQDASRSTVWGSSGAALYNSGTAPSKDARTFQVHGRLSAGQDVPAGAYTDTVTAGTFQGRRCRGASSRAG